MVTSLSVRILLLERSYGQLKNFQFPLQSRIMDNVLSVFSIFISVVHSKPKPEITQDQYREGTSNLLRIKAMVVQPDAQPCCSSLSSGSCISEQLVEMEETAAKVYCCRVCFEEELNSASLVAPCKCKGTGPYASYACGLPICSYLKSAQSHSTSTARTCVTYNISGSLCRHPEIRPHQVSSEVARECAKTESYRR